MVLDWFQKNAVVIIFYVSVFLLIYFNRKKFEFHGKIIAMYRTSLGLKFMKKIAEKHPKTIKILGVIGIYIGFLGMLLMLFLVFQGLHSLIFKPSEPPVFSPVLPGISIPGSPITLPLFKGLLALFVVVVIHEFSHGVVSKAYKIPIKSSGFVMFGPLPGAFVEPDEKKLRKSSYKAQMSMFAAGPFSNVLTALLIFALLIGLTFISSAMYDVNGVKIEGFTDAEDVLQGGRLANLQEGEIITMIENNTIRNVPNLIMALENVSPGTQIKISTLNDGYEQNKTIVLTNHPEQEDKAYLGIYLSNSIEGKTLLTKSKHFNSAYFWVAGNPFDSTFYGSTGLIGWIFILSLGIGLVNLLPLGPLDGGRMYLLTLQKHFKKKKAEHIWTKTSMFLFVVLLALIFIPIILAII